MSVRSHNTTVIAFFLFSMAILNLLTACEQVASVTVQIAPTLTKNPTQLSIDTPTPPATQTPMDTLMFTPTKPPTNMPMPVATVSDLLSYRATPAWHSPTSGICARLEGDIATFTIRPDIPDPRCVGVRPEQKVRVINRRAETLHVVIGLFEVDIEPYL